MSGRRSCGSRQGRSEPPRQGVMHPLLSAVLYWETFLTIPCSWSPGQWAGLPGCRAPPAVPGRPLATARRAAAGTAGGIRVRRRAALAAGARPRAGGGRRTDARAWPAIPWTRARTPCPMSAPGPARRRSGGCRRTSAVRAPGAVRRGHVSPGRAPTVLAATPRGAKRAANAWRRLSEARADAATVAAAEAGYRRAAEAQVPDEEVDSGILSTEGAGRRGPSGSAPGSPGGDLLPGRLAHLAGHVHEQVA